MLSFEVDGAAGQVFLQQAETVRVLVDESWPVCTSNATNVVMHGNKVAWLRADVSGRWLAAARVVIALWRDVSGICFGT